MDEAYGKIAYDAYVKQAGGVSLVSGVTLPEWDALPTEIQRAWIAAGIAVIDTAKSVSDI